MRAAASCHLCDLTSLLRFTERGADDLWGFSRGVNLVLLFGVHVVTEPQSRASQSAE